jgi:hypothetical protein
MDAATSILTFIYIAFDWSAGEIAKFFNYLDRPSSNLLLFGAVYYIITAIKKELKENREQIVKLIESVNKLERSLSILAYRMRKDEVEE